MLSGCGGTYNVGQQTFNSRIEAEQAHAQQVNQTMMGVLPTSNPVGGHVLLALPTLEHIEQNAIKFTGNKASISRDQIAYIKNTEMNGRKAMYTALQRRKIFDKATLVHNNNPPQTSLEGYDFLIYLHNPSPELAQWYIKKTDQEDGSHIIMDMGKPIGVPRTLSWLDSVENLAKNRKEFSTPKLPSFNILANSR